ncbi:MAG TPA: hypothetical protein VGG19_03840 [Tepidisphaeraceae bacterium]|jgi:hypothetical protein
MKDEGLHVHAKLQNRAQLLFMEAGEREREVAMARKNAAKKFGKSIFCVLPSRHRDFAFSLQSESRVAASQNAPRK